MPNGQTALYAWSANHRTLDTQTSGPPLISIEDECLRRLTILERCAWIPNRKYQQDGKAAV
jgi:hypothetical protein